MFGIPWKIVKNLSIPTRVDSKLFAYYAEMYVQGRSDCSKASQDQARFIINGHLLHAFGHYPVKEITSQLVRNYLASKKQTHKVTDHIKFFRAIMKLAREEGGEALPILKFKNPDPLNSEVGNPYTKEELTKLMYESRYNKNLRLQIFLCYTHGFRKSEVVHLPWEYLNLDEGICRLPASYLKTKARNREFPIGDVALRILRARRRRNPDSKYVFVGRDGITYQKDNDASWKRLKKRCGINKRYHDLRHTCVSRLVAAQFPIVFISQWLGMSPEIALKVYSHAPLAMGREAMSSRGKASVLNINRLKLIGKKS